ncbi:MULTISPECIES: hypothetical protein [unclassified Streptomyces]|uniref:hypothetical protein n=1 Tax=unclassified Streptomyces TaxID=2593676 RepID=UPI00278BECA8|nr:MULTISPECIES: hypothetical protein [unclassified Streptomyces]
MSNTVPSPRSSGEVERGDVAEVVALGNALTGLFNALEISQNAYAVRIHQDKSSVSRFLRGKKVAPQDFIDRLVREVEHKRGSQMKAEAREQLRQLRLAAVKETDPASYELEALRSEMERSHRQVDMLTRQQEALHDLLEKREAEVQAVRGELSQAQQDWRGEIALRMRLEAGAGGADHDRLDDEVAKLRADLEEVNALREDAERRCERLEQRVQEMEEELAARESDVAGAVPLAVLQERLLVLWEEGRSHEAGRELTEAAQGRSVAELVELVTWLDGLGDDVRRNRLAEEVVHTRTVDVVAEFGGALMGITFRRPSSRQRRRAPSALRCVIDEACAVMAPRDLVTLHRSWSPLAKKRRPRLRSPVLGNLLMGDRPADVTSEVLDQLGPDDESTLEAVRQWRPTSSWSGTLIALVPRLAARGRWDLARECCQALVHVSQQQVTQWGGPVFIGDMDGSPLEELDDSQIRDFVVAAEMLSPQELGFLLLLLYQLDIKAQRLQAEADRQFGRLLSHLRTPEVLTNVAAALQTAAFSKVYDGLPLKLREVLLAHQP